MKREAQASGEGKSMTKDELLCVLMAGARLHQSEAMAANDYRPDRSTIEYLLTAAMMREALKQCEHVRVEALCRKVVNVMTSSGCPAVRRSFGKKRFDVLIGKFLLPQAAIEVKIGVRSARKLLDDADKVLTTIAQLDRVRVPVFGALVFEIDVLGSGTIAREEDFTAVFKKLYNDIQTGLKSHIAANWPRVVVDFHLLAEAIEPAEIVKGVIEADGAATFICAAILANSLAGQSAHAAARSDVAPV